MLAFTAMTEYWPVCATYMVPPSGVTATPSGESAEMLSARMRVAGRIHLGDRESARQRHVGVVVGAGRAGATGLAAGVAAAPAGRAALPVANLIALLGALAGGRRVPPQRAGQAQARPRARR